MTVQAFLAFERRSCYRIGCLLLIKQIVCIRESSSLEVAGWQLDSRRGRGVFVLQFHQLLLAFLELGGIAFKRKERLPQVEFRSSLSRGQKRQKMLLLLQNTLLQIAMEYGQRSVAKGRLVTISRWKEQPNFVAKSVDLPTDPSFLWLWEEVSAAFLSYCIALSLLQQIDSALPVE